MNRTQEKAPDRIPEDEDTAVTRKKAATAAYAADKAAEAAPADVLFWKRTIVLHIIQTLGIIPPPHIKNNGGRPVRRCR
jgi:hypothetical protein